MEGTDSSDDVGGIGRENREGLHHKDNTIITDIALTLYLVDSGSIDICQVLLSGEHLALHDSRGLDILTYQLAMVEVYREGCSDCERVENPYKALALLNKPTGIYFGKLQVRKGIADNNRTMAMSLAERATGEPLKGVPTFFYFRSGRITGLSVEPTEQQLYADAQNYLGVGLILPNQGE
ncbi:hypothetical protein C4573_06970 [Candidatus Woesearchaeota archaeon]|nr:MAG: hypothetical protein C4573_06970 [Candidatus Woesearchaeota archaeon]